MKLIAIIATAAMAVGFYSAVEATPVSSAKDVVICQQSVRPCTYCKGTGMFGSTPCVHCKGWGKVKTNGMPL